MKVVSQLLHLIRAFRMWVKISHVLGYTVQYLNRQMLTLICSVPIVGSVMRGGACD